MKCYILAGGRSRRFGRDKLLHEIGGKKVIERVLDTAKVVCDEVFLITKNPSKFRFLDVPIILDAFSIHASMIGLYTALSHAETPSLILSGDVPLLTPQIIERLIKDYEPPITLARTKEKIHTLVGVYSPDVLEILEEYIKNENYKLYEFVKRVGFKTVLFKGKEANHLLNLNTEEDLSRLIAIANHS